MRKCEVRNLGRMGYEAAFELQRRLVEQRKQGLIPDQFLFVEHPHTITLGRNAHRENLLASDRALAAAGVSVYESDRGGDITYHGPGQIVGYLILDLRQWKRDVGAYVRAIEQTLIDALADFDLPAGRLAGCPGVWVDGRKIGALGVHISRWVTSHGFALNLSTDLACFRYINPCGLSRPVTSMAEMGVRPVTADVQASLARHFGEIFHREILEPVETAI